MAWLSLWFVIGYVMYSFVFATMGATVSRLEDLQSLTYVPSVLLLPAYAVAAASLAGGTSPLLAPMSLVPVWSPLLMPFRIVTGDAAWWEVVVALAGSVAFIALLVWFGARVYRGAALRMGGRVSPRGVAGGLSAERGGAGGRIGPCCDTPWLGPGPSAGSTGSGWRMRVPPSSSCSGDAGADAVRTHGLDLRSPDGDLHLERRPRRA